MAHYYSDVRREESPTALPDVEVFHMSRAEVQLVGWVDAEGDAKEAGWYWWCCLSGCLPDSDPYGPFTSESEAVSDMRDYFSD